jgi:hypothetical protein
MPITNTDEYPLSTDQGTAITSSGTFLRDWYYAEGLGVVEKDDSIKPHLTRYRVYIDGKYAFTYPCQHYGSLTEALEHIVRVSHCFVFERDGNGGMLVKRQSNGETVLHTSSQSYAAVEEHVKVVEDI